MRADPPRLGGLNFPLTCPPFLSALDLSSFLNIPLGNQGPIPALAVSGFAFLQAAQRSVLAAFRAVHPAPEIQP